MNPSERFSDLFDQAPNHFSFLLKSPSEALATVRISVVRPDLGWLDSPARHVYGDSQSFQVFTDTTYIEASRLCFTPQAPSGTFISLLGNVAALAEFYSVRWLVVSPRVEQVLAYQKLFGFTPQAEPRAYDSLRFTTQLLAVSLADLRSHIQHDRRMFRSWACALAAACNPAMPGEFAAA